MTPPVQSDPVRPPRPWSRPSSAVLASVLIVVLAAIWLPDHFAPIAVGCILFDLLMLAAFVAQLSRWALGVQKLIEQTQADASPHR